VREGSDFAVKLKERRKEVFDLPSENEYGYYKSKSLGREQAS